MCFKKFTLSFGNLVSAALSVLSQRPVNWPKYEAWVIRKPHLGLFWSFSPTRAHHFGNSLRKVEEKY